MCPPDEEIDTAPNASDSEITRYEKSFLATRRVLDEAIRNLSILKKLEKNLDRRESIGADLADTQLKRNALARANVAFHAHLATMVPPSPAQVAELHALATEATGLTTQRATAAASLQLATKALNKFAAVQSI